MLLGCLEEHGLVCCGGSDSMFGLLECVCGLKGMHGN